MTVPAVVRNKALAAGAESWLRGLPDLIERVSTGLLLTRDGLQPVGREMLAAADYVCGA